MRVGTLYNCTVLRSIDVSQFPFTPSRLTQMNWLSLIAFVSAASAQSLTIPSNWRVRAHCYLYVCLRSKRSDLRNRLSRKRGQSVLTSPEAPSTSSIATMTPRLDATTSRLHLLRTSPSTIVSCPHAIPPRPSSNIRPAFIDQDDTLEWARHGASGLRYTVMHDFIARTTVYENFTTGALLRAVDTNARTILGAPMDNLMTETFEQLGLAASVAYTAYGNPDMLSLAKTIQGIIDEYISTNQGAGYPGAEEATQKCATTGLGGIIFPYLSGTPSPTSHLQEYGWIKSSDWSSYLSCVYISRFSGLRCYSCSTDSLSSYVALASGDSIVRNDATRMYEVLSSGAVPNLVRTNDSFAHHIYVYNASAAATSDVDSPLRTDADHTFANCEGYDAQSPSGGNLVQAYSAYNALVSSPSVNQR